MASSLAFLPPVAVATAMFLSLLRMPALFGLGLRRSAADREASGRGPVEPDPGPTRPADDPQAAPVITFTAYPVVSVTDGKPVAAVAIEPCFRGADQRPLAAEAIDWRRMPERMLARLDTTLLNRALAFAEVCAEEGRRDAVIISVSATSLEDHGFVGRLARYFDQPRHARPRLVVLIRGGEGDVDALAHLPAPWRESLGLHMVSALSDETALQRCLSAGLGCLQVDASLLFGDLDAVDRTARLMARVAVAKVPVVVNGVGDDVLLRRLRSFPALFARGPLFGSLAPLAA